MARSSAAASETWRSNLKVIGYCLIVAFAATNFGFDQGETGGFFAMEQFAKDFGVYDASTDSYGLTAGSITCMYGLEIGAMALAAFASGFIGSRWGRKLGLVLCAITGLIGAALQMVASWPAQLVGRIFMGASIGLCGNFTIPYWSEAAPAGIRGIVCIFYQLFTNIPNFIGACVDQATYEMPNRWSYRIPLLTTMISPLLLLSLVWIVPESPRWLITKDRVEEARKSLRKIRGKTIPQAELDRELDEAIAFTALERELEESTSYLECLKGTDLRRTLIACLAMSGQQLTGIAFVSGYSTYFFEEVGISNSFLDTVIVDACTIAGPVSALILCRFVGRRPILLLGTFICGFSMFALSIVSQAAPNSTAAGNCLVAFTCIYSYSYGLSWGAFGPVVMGEIPSNRLRSKTISLSLTINWLWCLAIITSVPYLLSAEYANLGTKLGYLFGAMNVVLLIITWIIVPETKDRTLEEIDEMFLNAVPTKEFKSYVCTGEAAGYDIRGMNKEKERIEVVEVENA
ncbi:hypothetical protein ASPZODRAFT_157007 [Penicilliopsis zonata CBS 506.65]|uniref:Major facilitator superfamily (MFS) profile domain-containing protein n=1 Tax=Penicilliopsis zonata CBS 506.65 TaxID=1073090 RepID=A0A1L9SS29_9EURO|nr:hypothetical protein ASPZODRAFT_157007 [Penicilliopsis zonata CBS 506.65]OJJ49998.1 hypothetical protein ASPZODRAFT_157007 [Penicilliopsis zonata CBS 506.65]